MLPTTNAAELSELKAQGQAFLVANQVERAESIYLSILRDNPQDVEAYVLLGDCYRLGGDIETAVLLYTEALKFDPGNIEIRKRRSETVSQIVEDLSSRLDTPTGPEAFAYSASTVPSDTGSVAGLLQKLTGKEVQVSDEDVMRAAELLRKVINSPRPAQAVAEHLDEIDDLLPALLELNIRQARADGRPDLAKGLEALQNNIQIQVYAQPAGLPPPVYSPARSAPLVRRVLFLGPFHTDAPPRQSLPAEALRGQGWSTTVATQFPPDFQSRFDAVVAHNPHGDPRLLQGLAACSAANIPVIIDLDADFEQMPAIHPDFNWLGLGTPSGAKAYKAALLLADLICVPCEPLANHLRAGGFPAQVIPDGWNRTNTLWDKPSSRRHSLNLGWIGQPGQLEDVAHIRRMVVRVLREFQQTKLIIVGDPQVYQLFDSVPESRRLFLPPVEPEDYPYLLGQIDILIAPYRNLPFNLSMSDRLLMEAGIRQIPWVASPMPAFSAWDAGGLVANTIDEWHTHLRQLVLDANLRVTLGRAGRLKAEGREMALLGRSWSEMINACILKRAKNETRADR